MKDYVMIFTNGLKAHSKVCARELFPDPYLKNQN